MRLFLICLIVAGLALSGCSGQKQPYPDTPLLYSETKFFRAFSLNNIVEQLHPPKLTGPSGNHSESSSPFHRRKTFNFTYLIEEGEGTKFDEVGFIARLKAEAEKIADGAEVRTSSGGGSEGAFSLNYYDENHEGWVEVVGTRIEGNKYKLWCVLIENTKKACR